MSHTAKKTPDHKTGQLIKTISEYLRLSCVGQHADVLRPELIEIIKTHKLTTFNVSHVFRSKDAAAIKAVIEQGFDFNKVPMMKSFTAFSYADLPTERRCEIFDLITQKMQPNPEGALQAGRQALDAHDEDFLDAVLEWSPKTSLESILWDRYLHDATVQAAPEFWLKILRRADMNAPHSQRKAARLITHGISPYTLAIMVALGLPVYRLILECEAVNTRQPAWLKRFRERAGSAHGEIALKANMPPLEEIIAMPEAHIETLLGGLSNRQKRKIKAFQRKGKMPKSLAEIAQVAKEDVSLDA